MKEYLDELNLIDLISEMHQTLRIKVNDIWNKNNIEKISQTESHILAIVQFRPRTVAEIAREINISRQAAHKCAQNMISRGYLKTENIEGNQREKLILLTEQGEKCCFELMKIKKHIEKQIEDEIGSTTVEIMKLILRQKWI